MKHSARHNQPLVTPEDKKVWQKVTRTVSPRRRLRGKGSAKADPSRDDFAAMLRLPPVAKPAERAFSQTLDINRDKRVRRGRVEIDATIDLHDLTQAQARPALVKAIIRASNRNYKTVLVITGKGLRGEGVLRRNFPEWVSQTPIRPIVATYAPAHQKHGGGGAWYVFLKQG